MKKLTSIFLSLVMIIGLAACSQAPESHTSSENSTTLSNSTVQTDSEDTSGENSTDSISDTSNNDSDSNTSANGSTNSNSQNTNNGSNNVRVTVLRPQPAASTISRCVSPRLFSRRISL